MRLLSRLIGAKEQRPARTVADTGTIRVMAVAGLAYDAGLVDRLKNEHRELARLFMEIKAAASAGQFSKLTVLLLHLKLAFQTHIMLENVKLYAYVQQRCAHDAETLAFIAAGHREADEIARAVKKFVKTYANAQFGHDTIAPFLAELDHIIALVLRRMELEENRLYALYQQA